jgi:hypothetical protein
MKKIGNYTVRGLIEPGSSSLGLTKKIQLFDGRFDTAFKVTRFELMFEDPDNTSNDVYGILLTEFLYSGTDQTWDFSENRQLGWASAANVYSDAGTPGTPFNLIDRDNLIVEDLFVYVRSGTSTAGVNYYIEMEKYDISESIGALTMVRNSGQNVE